MKVLVVGSGGREHALAWKIARSSLVNEVICAPGNAGIASVARCVQVGAGDIDGIRDLARTEAVDLVVVGPEAPLVEGMADRLREDGRLVFGPSAEAAALEGSKAFAKQFMARHGVPTAGFEVFDAYGPLVAHLEGREGPIVLKADGLAAGKGVLMCRSRLEALNGATHIMKEGAFGEAGRRVIAEDLLVGEEASYLVIVDGENVVPLASSQDHKRMLEGDKGPNTGGMGAYSPAPVLTHELEQRVLDEVIHPTVQGMVAEGRPFSGLLYAGLMIVDGDPFVLEFNVRFGDPECQPLLLRLREDLVPLLVASASGKLAPRKLAWRPGATCCVVMASDGYPGAYETGVPIRGLHKVEESSDLVVFHAGTALVPADDGPQPVTAGGRVLGITSYGEDIIEARNRVYKAMEPIRWPGAVYRRDIGYRAVARLKESK
jgi:phosphoribosylamine---glycine ligase